MAAALLTPETVTLHNIPYVRDIITQRRLLEDIGATVLTPELRTHKITASHIELFEAPLIQLVERVEHRAAVGAADALGVRQIQDGIARAAQRYGMVVRDGSEVVTFYAQDPTPTGSNPWLTWFGGKSAARALAGFPWDRLQVVPPTAG